MTFRFSFVSTHTDLLNAYDAERSVRSGLSAWSRGAVMLLGAMWLVGFLVLGPSAAKETPMLPFVWLGLGVLIFWKLGFKPYLEKQRIKETNDAEQKVFLSFTDSEITSLAPDGSNFSRAWSELAGVESSKLGVLLGFKDGVRNWIPNRAFKDAGEKAAFVSHVIQIARSMEHP